MSKRPSKKRSSHLYMQVNRYSERRATRNQRYEEGGRRKAHTLNKRNAWQSEKAFPSDGEWKRLKRNKIGMLLSDDSFLFSRLSLVAVFAHRHKHIQARLVPVSHLLQFANTSIALGSLSFIFVSNFRIALKFQLNGRRHIYSNTQSWKWQNFH